LRETFTPQPSLPPTYEKKNFRPICDALPFSPLVPLLLSQSSAIKSLDHLPVRLEAVNNKQFLELSPDGLTVSYHGQAFNDEDVGVVLSDQPFSHHLPFFYYEVHIENGGDSGGKSLISTFLFLIFIFIFFPYPFFFPHPLNSSYLLLDLLLYSSISSSRPWLS